MNGLNSKGNLENNANLQNELELLLLQKQSNRGLILERERELSINRSGSAPPTVDGSLCTAGSLIKNPNFMTLDNDGNSSGTSGNNGAMTEEEIRSLPAYLEYYYSHENLNPRLPPPLLSKEDWRIAQRIRAAGSGFGGVGDWRNENLVDDGVQSSLFSMQPGISVQKAEDELIELRKAALRNLSRKNSFDYLHRASTGSSSTGLGVRRKSFADILQVFSLFIFTVKFTLLYCTCKILWNSKFCLCSCKLFRISSSVSVVTRNYNYCWLLLLLLANSLKLLTK